MIQANPEKQTLPVSLQFIVDKLTLERKLVPSAMRRILLQANVQPADLEPWADFDHPVSDSYGRKLVYQGANFEIMVMSWAPEDYSAIHDHGNTQWGAVQVFGTAEHATFRIDDDKISTLSRQVMQPGDAVGVHHDLVHQMGNPSSTDSFFSLHVYGTVVDNTSITGGARVFDLARNTIAFVDGGVFYALPAEAIVREAPGPQPDFPTRLRHMVELIRRLQKMTAAAVPGAADQLAEATALFLDPQQQQQLLRCLAANTDEADQQDNSLYWRTLQRELLAAAELQRTLLQQSSSADKFHRYAALYDAVIGQPCLDQFVADYIAFFSESFQQHLPEKKLISLGCGTGLTEEYLLNHYQIPRENLLGIDISAAMVQEAQARIVARQEDLLQLPESYNHQWDLAYSGLNVFHYLDYHRLEEAIARTAALLQPGGYFLGDFITPDHIRWYPNVMYGANNQIISLRTPRLVEEDGRMFQESAIINIDFTGGTMEITDAGRHRRFLPPLHRVRGYFERHFTGGVWLYDAVTKQPIPEWADSCPSTRYVVVAQRS